MTLEPRRRGCSPSTRAAAHRGGVDVASVPRGGARSSARSRSILVPAGKGVSDLRTELTAPIRILTRSSRCCCSSPARMSRTCCWRARWAAERDRDPAGGGRDAAASDPATGGGERAAFGGGRRDRAAGGGVDRERAAWDSVRLGGDGAHGGRSTGESSRSRSLGGGYGLGLRPRARLEGDLAGDRAHP